MTAASAAPSRALGLGWRGAAVAYIALTLAYGWPLVRSIGTVLPSDIGDPGLNAWIVWWNAQAWPLTEHWWNAPVFFPMAGAFALSETLLSLAPITTPLQWLGAGPVAAYNVAFLVSFPASALAAHALAHRLTGRHDVALLAGLAFGFSPYRAGQMPHIQMQLAFWMPLCLLALHRYLDTRKRGVLVLAGVCWLLNGLSSGYYLFFFAVLVGLWMLWFLREWRDWLRVLTTMAVATMPLVPLLVGYQTRLDAIGASRGRGEIERLSADLSAVWAVSPHAWLPSHWTLSPRPEGELYPGVVILALAIVGAAVAWRMNVRGWRPDLKRGLFLTGVVALSAAFMVWVTGGVQGEILGVPISVTRPHRLVGIGIWLLIASLVHDPRVSGGWRRRSVWLFYVLATGAMFAFALGPVGRVFETRFMDKAPYFWLMQLPGGSSLRVPARFAMLFMLCLGQAASLGLSRLMPRGVGTVRLAALAVLVLADGWVPRMQTAPAPAPMTLSGLDPAAVVVELPSRSLYDDTAAMLRATGHGYPLVNGFSGYFPPHYGALQEGLTAMDVSVFDTLRTLSPLIVIIDRAHDENGTYAAWLADMADARREPDSSAGPVYSLSRRPPSTRPGAPLRIATVEANRNTALAPLATDGDLDTRWETGGAQTVGDEFTIMLAESATIGRIEMDLAGDTYDYPRALRVSVAAGDEAPMVAWEGGLSGPALLGAHEDRRRTTVAIDLPPATGGRRVHLTVVTGDESAYWSIRELRVFGAPARQP